MARKGQKVRYTLNSADIKFLDEEEIRAILRAADMIIATGGRSMLAKILKGSKDKKILEYGLDQCPTYGYYRQLTLEQITNHIDWTIQQDYLRIDYMGKLPIMKIENK